MALFGKETPHVRIDELRSTTPEPIEAVAAGVGGFVIDAGEGPTGEARYCTSWSEFLDLYGGLRADMDGPWELAGYWAQNRSLPAHIVRVVGDGAAKAAVTLADSSSVDTLTLTAWGEGVWGNELDVEITDASSTDDADFFRLKLRRVDAVTGATREIDYGDVTMDQSSEYYAVDVVNAWDQWVVAADEGAGVRPENTGGWSDLTGGLDGDAPDDDDFIGSDDGGTRTGGFILDTVDEVTLLRYAGRSSETVNNAVLARAAACEDRYGIVCLGDGAPSGAAALVAALTATRYGAAYHNKVYVSNPLAGGKKELFPGGHIAGKLAAAPPHHSPAYGEIKGVIGVTRQLSAGEIETVTLAGACPVVGEWKKVGSRKMRVYRLANGLSLSSDLSWSQVSKVRKALQLIESLDEGLQVYRSAPNTRDHRGTLKAAIDTLLAPEKREQNIVDYQIDVSEELNPPALQQQRIVRARVAVAYIHPGDYVWVQIDHDWTSGASEIS